MFSNRPHSIDLEIDGGTLATDSDGNVSIGQSSWTEDVPCRVERNSQASYITTDGKQYTYAYVVYLDADTPSLFNGQNVRIHFEGITEEKQIVGFSKDRLHTRIWL